MPKYGFVGTDKYQMYLIFNLFVFVTNPNELLCEVVIQLSTIDES